MGKVFVMLGFDNQDQIMRMVYQGIEDVHHDALRKLLLPSLHITQTRDEIFEEVADLSHWDGRGNNFSCQRMLRTHILKKEIFPHDGDGENDLSKFKKAYTLCSMIRHALCVHLGLSAFSDRDYGGRKKIESAGETIAFVVRAHNKIEVRRLLKKIQEVMSGM